MIYDPLCKIHNLKCEFPYSHLHTRLSLHSNGWNCEILAFFRPGKPPEDEVSSAASRAPNRRWKWRGPRWRGPKGPWTSCRSCCCADVSGSACPPSPATDCPFRAISHWRSRRRSWPCARSTAAAAGEAAAAPSTAANFAPNGARISRTPVDGARKTRAELFSGWPSKWDRKRGGVCRGPGTCTWSVAEAAPVASPARLSARPRIIEGVGETTLFWNDDREGNQCKSWPIIYLFIQLFHYYTGSILSILQSSSILHELFS